MNTNYASSLYFDIEHVTLENHRACIVLERVEAITYQDPDNIPSNLIALDNHTNGAEHHE